MVLMQQHNMKEEMMLYPMSQQYIPIELGVLEAINFLLIFMLYGGD